MAYHRLVLPSYYISGGGSLPAGYDMLNDPITGGTGTGIPTPADTSDKVGGVYDGTYFIAELENANANDLNRPAYALGANTDALDDKMHRVTRIASTIVSSRTSTSDVSVTVTSTRTIWSSLTSFSVITPTGGPLYVGGVRVTVSSVSGAVDADGFFTTTGTLTFNTTIPVGVVYSVIGALRNIFETLEGTNASLNWQPQIADDQIAKYRTDFDITTVSDAVNSFGGDYHAADITSLIDATRDRTNVLMRAGTYIITGTASWSHGGRFEAAKPGSVLIRIGSSRATGVAMSSTVNGGTQLRNVSLGTFSTTGRFVANGPFEYIAYTIADTVDAGSLELSATLASYNQRISGMVINAASSATNATGSLMISGAGNIEIENLYITQVPTASTPAAALYFSSFTGQCVIRNSVVGITNAVTALSLSSVTGKVIFDNCSFTTTGTGDIWAVNIINSSNVVFRNCRFFSSGGQVARNENSNVTYDHCEFTSGTLAGLTNPQLFCGEGSSTGDKPLRLLNCAMYFNTSNPVTSGAPTKPIIELGGRNATPNAGRVEVDGLYIRATSGGVGYHLYTTVLLLDHTGNGAPNVYRNLVLDDGGRTPAAGGTLAHYQSAIGAFTYLMEAVGVADRKRMIVQGVRAINVKAPATSVSRGVLYFERVKGSDVVLNGSTASAGFYTNGLVELTDSDIDGLHMFPQTPLEATNTTEIKLNTGSRLSGLRYHRRSLALAAQRLIYVDADCVLESALIYSDIALTISGVAELIKLSGNRSTMRNCEVVINGTLTGGPIVNSTIVEAAMSNCYLRWENTAADTIASFTGARCLVEGNRLFSTLTNAPALVNSGTSSVSSANVIAPSADTGNPVVY